MATQLQAGISKDTVKELSATLDEPDWLLEKRLEALAALDDLEFPSVIKTPGRRWTNLEDLDFDELVAPMSQTETK
ncbi:MAG: Fe-S cluster assembly protein SufD, partial [Halobacteriaceae archaeon]